MPYISGVWLYILVYVLCRWWGFGLVMCEMNFLVVSGIKKFKYS